HAHPLGPSTLAPESYGLDQPDHCVDRRPEREKPEVARRGTLGQLEENPRIRAGWVEVKVADEALRHRLDVAVDQEEQAGSRGEDDAALEGLEESDRAKAG